MKPNDPQKIRLEPDDHKEAVRALQQFFRETREEEISDFQATALLEFFLSRIAPAIYNRALADTHAVLVQKLDDIYGLEKRILP